MMLLPVVGYLEWMCFPNAVTDSGKPGSVSGIRIHSSTAEERHSIRHCSIWSTDFMALNFSARMACRLVTDVGLSWCMSFSVRTAGLSKPFRWML